VRAAELPDAPEHCFKVEFDKEEAFGNGPS
jgi:hypothetical protein